MDTPNIDRLAREGAMFQNAFVTTPLFSPSRASCAPKAASSTAAMKSVAELRGERRSDGARKIKLYAVER